MSSRQQFLLLAAFIIQNVWGMGHLFLAFPHLNSLLDLLNDLVLNGRITQDVVWGDAGLTAVGVLSPGDAPVRQERS